MKQQEVQLAFKKIKNINYEISETIVSSIEVSELRLFQTTIENTFVIDKERKEQNRALWNKALCAATGKVEINDFISYISEYFTNHRSQLDPSYEKIINKIHKTYELYLTERDENKLNKFHEPSVKSLYQLVRFIPEYPMQNIEIYLDENSGAFGLNILSNRNGKPILNILMKENKEVLFSFIKKNNEFVKITGRAYFNNNLDDSFEINKILKWVVND